MIYRKKDQTGATDGRRWCARYLILLRIEEGAILGIATSTGAALEEMVVSVTILRFLGVNVSRTVKKDNCSSRNKHPMFDVKT